MRHFVTKLVVTKLVVTKLLASKLLASKAFRPAAPGVARALACAPRRWRGPAAALAALAAFVAPSATQNAVANGDTRTLTFYHTHTGESIQITYLSGGSYDSSALEKLNYFLRDWRNDQQTRMDPRLFDVLWEVQRAAGSRDAIKVLSAYRSPTTNAMLRRSSRGVAEHSQHIRGKAIDIHVDDVGLSRLREVGMRLQRGGVGYYPAHSFVHLDTGSVRHWPRMSYDQLARLFPDGKTVHIPSNGQPMAGYDQALAEIEAGGGSAYASAYVTGQKSKGLFAFLFGGGAEDDTAEVEEATAGRRGSRTARAQRGGGRVAVASAAATSDDGGSKTFFSGLFSRSPAQETQVAALDPREEANRRVQERAAAAEARAQAKRQADEAKAESKRQADEAKAESKRQADEAKAQAKRQADEAAQARAQDKSQDKTQDKTPEAAPSPADKALEAKMIADARSDAARQKFEERLGVAPAPPRRPSESIIASLTASDVPLPPLRPVGLSSVRTAQPGGLAGKKLSELEDGALPALITEGAGEQGPVGKALAYAPTPVRRPAPAAVVRPGEPAQPTATLTAPRIDRATFRALAAPTASERSPSQTALAPTVTPLRAARAAMATSLADRGGVATSFGASPTGDLSATQFSGKAVSSLPRVTQFGDLPLRLNTDDEN